jgi:cation transport ATPase
MKRLQFILAVTGVMVLASCSNYNSFSKRKYTKGVFHSNSARLKVEKEQNKQPSQALAIEKQATAASKGISVEEKIVSQEHSVNLEEKVNIKPAEMGTTIRRDRIDHEQLEETSEIHSTINQEAFQGDLNADQKKDQKRTKKERKSLTDEEKRARATLILGLISIGLVVSLFVLLPFIAFPGAFFSALGLFRVSALVAFLGIYEGAFFYKEPLEGKYKKFRRKGLFFSVLVVALSIVLFVF